MGSNVAALKEKISVQAKIIVDHESTILEKVKEIEGIRTQAESTGKALGETLFQHMNKIDKLESQVNTLINVLGKTTR